MKKTFIKKPCRFCGRLISNCGLATSNHQSMHEREGLYKEGRVTALGSIVLRLTGKEKEMPG